MRTLKLLFLLLISINCFAQVTLDKTVRKKYKMAFKKMNVLYQQEMKQLEKKDPYTGISIFTAYYEDTLNKEEIINEGMDVTFTIIDPNSNKKVEMEGNENIYIPVFSEADLHNDTLHFAVGWPFPPIIHHKVYLGQVTSDYEEYYKYDRVLRLDLKDTKVSELSIPVITKKFLISKSSFKAGKIIYGQVEFETVPYYHDSFGFKNNYIKKRLRCVYLFKVRVREKNT